MKSVYTVAYRRKREGKTDYRSRLALLKSKIPRLVVRKSNKHTLAQLVKYDEKGDKVMAAAHSRELAKLGWNISTRNIPAAYLTGLLLGAKCRGQRAILDLGSQVSNSGSRIFAVVRGAGDAGLQVKHSAEALPAPERITGRHISGFASRSSHRFSKYLTNAPGGIEGLFDNTKAKIMQGGKE